MNWLPIQATLRQLAALSGITPSAIAWEGSPYASNLEVGARLLMSIGTVRGIGEDIETRVDSVDGTDAVVHVQGNRQFTWIARFESMSSQAPLDALTYAENLRSRLSRSTAVDIAMAGNIAIVDVGDTTKVDYVVQQRKVSCYQVLVTVGATEDDVDTTTGAGGYVATANMDGTLSSGDVGVDVPATAGPVT